VIAKTLEFGPMNGLIQGFRRRLGMNIIPAEKGRLQAFRCLARNEVLGMHVDMVDPGEGIIVDFLSGQAEMSTPARIAIRTGARVVPAVVVRDPADDRRFLSSSTWPHVRAHGDEEADVALTERIAHASSPSCGATPTSGSPFCPSGATGDPAPAVNWNDRLNHYALELTNLLFQIRAGCRTAARVVGDLGRGAQGHSCRRRRQHVSRPRAFSTRRRVSANARGLPQRLQVLQT
jgi:hypothetical protein